MTLLAHLPELGTPDRMQIAALVGVAPMNRDSGITRGRRTVPGGRARVRAVLYRGTLAASRHNPVIPGFYQLLLAAGKPRKLAFNACMRKLLTIPSGMAKSGPALESTRHQGLTSKTVAFNCWKGREIIE